MGEIPPWLVPPNFIGAMQSGAAAGTSARAEDIQQQSAADRLRLAYDQIAHNERMESMQTLAKMKMGEAANALRAVHNDALLQHYKNMEEQQQARTDALSNKDYGEPITTDLGNGNKYVYRKGSPGGHLIKDYHPKATLKYGPNGEFQGISGDPSAPEVADFRAQSVAKKAADDLAAQQPGVFSRAYNYLTGNKPVAAPKSKFKVLAVDGKPVQTTTTDDEEDDGM